MASENQYDEIIIGAGAGGLAAAAWLAKAGKKTLLLEKEQHLGGLFAPLAHRDYRFDVGARLLMGCNADGPFGPGAIHTFLDQIGARRLVDFIPLQPILDMRFPDSRFSIFTGQEQFIAGLEQAASRGLDRLPELLELCRKLYRQSTVFSNGEQPWTPWQVMRRMPGMVRFATTTLDSVLSNYFTDPRARAVMGVLWPYIGLPPRQGAFLPWALMISAYIDEGAWYCRGGLGSLADAIGEAFTMAGGDLRTGSPVRRVLVERRQVVGVEMANGERFFAPKVIAGIDPRLVFGPMMDPAEAPGRYRRRLGRLTSSNTGVSVSCVTDLDLAGMGFRFENLIFDSWDENTVSRTPFTDQVGFFSLTISNLADPGLAPPGQYSVSSFTGLPSQAPLGPADVKRYARVLKQTVEQHVPGLAGRMLLRGDEGDGYLVRPSTPVYGWENTPWQAGVGRPEQRTPIHGLLLAGHWARPLHGVMPAILSGLEAARIILR